jgi:hypothetical protein
MLSITLCYRTLSNMLRLNGEVAALLANLSQIAGHD